MLQPEAFNSKLHFIWFPSSCLGTQFTAPLCFATKVKTWCKFIETFRAAFNSKLETRNSKLPPRVYPVSLGCAKNRVDTEIMLALLEEAGWEITSQPQEADLLLVNTCGFIASACQEAIDTLLELAAVKQSRPGTTLVAAGCLVQRYQQDLPGLLPEVDIFLGVNDFPNIINILATKSVSRQCAGGLSGRVARLPAGLAPAVDHAFLQRLPQNSRRLQPPLHLLHHPRHPGTLTAAVPWIRCWPKPGSWRHAALLS